MIFDPQSGKYLEEALDSPSPYLGLSENLYYFGPLNYYQLSGDKFVHTVIHNEYDMSFAECRSLQSAFDTALQNSVCKGLLRSGRCRSISPYANESKFEGKC